jgi:drug/metabolite transporter (DMT)-like permease
MNLRVALVALLGSAGLASAYLAASIRTVEASSSWFFAAVAVLLLLLAGFAALPARKRKPEPARFVPAWYLDSVALLLSVFVGLAMAIYLLNALLRK